MRVVEEKIIAAIRKGKSMKCGKNDKVVAYSEGAIVFLHGHAIAKVTDKEVSFSSCGWQTVTTKSRLNAILGTFAHSHITQRDFAWYLNGTTPVPGYDSMTLPRKN